MTPEEIVEWAAEVLAAHQFWVQPGQTLACACESWVGEPGDGSHRRHQAQMLAAAGLLPTGGMERGRRDPEDGVVIQNPYIPRRFQPVVRYCTPWQEEVR